MPAPAVHGHRGRTAILAATILVVLAGGLFTWSAASSSEAAAAQPTTDATAVPSAETVVTSSRAIRATESPSATPTPTPTTSVPAVEPIVPAVEAIVAVVGAVVEPTIVPAVDTSVEIASAGPVPAPAPAPAPAAPTNQSGCRGDLPRAVMTIEMPDLGYTCPVYAGGQSTIDAGAVTLITDQGTSPLLATHPGGTGTLWIAAHRSSHGGAFAAVPDLADGAIVTVSDGSHTASYRVVGRAYVEARDGLVVDASGQATNAATLDSVLRTDRGGNLAPRLILQTCDGPSFRWMVYADLVTG